MTDQELRALVRRVLAQRDAGSRPSPATPGWPGAPAPAPSASADAAAAALRHHASHALFVIPAQGDACIIEPGVACNHCGYCKSYGH